MTNTKTLFELAQENEDKTFDEIIAKQDAREQFVKQIDYLALEKSRLEGQTILFKEAVESTSEAFKISKSEITKLVAAITKDKLDETLETTIRFADCLEIIKGVDGGEGCEND